MKCNYYIYVTDVSLLK